MGGFGIGATEFVAMGLLPELAADLLPALTASAPEEAIARAGWLISAYALGVVVGAPTIAAAAARWPRKQLLLWLVTAFTLGTVASALLPTFELVLVARFVSAVPHGAYFGIASLVAASLMGPGKRARGVALVLSGLTIANVVGVPAITWLGQQTTWRVAYLAVAAIFALTFVAIALVVPWQPGDATASIRRELGAFRRVQVWLALGIGSIGFGGFFAVYTYIAPLATDVAGLPAASVPIVLMVVGVGMTIGNLLGGWSADRSVRRSLRGYFVALAVALAALGLVASWPPGLIVGALVVGAAAAALSPVIQARLMDVAGDSQSIAAALNHSALNLGNSLGAAAGGAAIAFRDAISAIQWLSFGFGGEQVATLAAGLPWWQILLVPVAGGLVIGLFIRYFMPDGRPQSVSHVIEASALHDARMSLTVGIRAALASAASIGVGASVGREGPVVHLGASLGSWAAKRLHLGRVLARTLLGCGVAAGVAASFNAPIAGSFFALEVVVGHYALSAFAPIVIASVTGTLILIATPLCSSILRTVTVLTGSLGPLSLAAMKRRSATAGRPKARTTDEPSIATP